MTPDPLDEHFQLTESQGAEDRFRKNVKWLDGSGVPYVVEGGWAVAAYGSPTPSVDLDILVPSAHYELLVTVCRNTSGIQLDTAAGRAMLSLDIDFSDMKNHLFARPDLFYIPEELLRNRIVERVLRTVLGDLQLRVPRADALAFMKLKAFRDRALQWHLSREPAELAALDREDALQVRAHPTGHWERKAGKDLYDVGYLLGNHVDKPDLDILLPDDQLTLELVNSVHKIPGPLQSFANAMARRSRAKILPPERLYALLAPVP